MPRRQSTPGPIAPAQCRFRLDTRGEPRPNVLCMIWNNLFKVNGTRKARGCLDGAVCAAPWLRHNNQTYSSCIKQPHQRLLYAIAEFLGKVVTFADATNVYQQSPPPSNQCYLMIDDAYHSWYLKHFDVSLDPATHVIPLNRALQGHPEAGILWERMIVGILESPNLGFTSTTHERNLYCGVVDSETVIICRQVDDFSIAADTCAVADNIIAIINCHVTTDNKGIGILIPDGFHMSYNGVDIHQTQSYIKLSCVTYINHLLQTHGWVEPGLHESDCHDSVPICSDDVPTLQSLVGPLESTTAHCLLEQQMGFSYRQVLGEIMYAYVVCRVDIGFATTTFGTVFFGSCCWSMSEYQ
jgi:Reverse transcriptase (RNA-dependent DNA polymerase)